MDHASFGQSHVVAVPYPGRGHINPMLNLMNSISSRRPNDVITLIVTEEWVGLLGSDPRLEPLQIRSIPNVLPSEHGRFADMNRFIEAVLTMMESPIERLLDELDPPPSIIVADAFLPWAVDVSRRKNIPVASFWCMNATVFSVFENLDLILEHGHCPTKPSLDEVVDYIPGVSPTLVADLPSILHNPDGELLRSLGETFSRIREACCVVFSSIYEVEPRPIDAVRAKLPIPVYCAGPLVPRISGPPSRTRFMEWLDSRLSESVLYVSMGSLVFVSDAQMEEIAAGLAGSGCWYLWVARDGAFGLNARSEEKGFVVDWCDQLGVLHHPAVGGFWTHCGWNSVQEGMFAGVPMLCFPVGMDQGPNSKLIEIDWMAGMRLNRSNGMGEELVSRDEIAERVRKFMDLESSERRQMVINARELQVLARTARAAGGSSEVDLRSFIKEHISSV